MNGRKVLQSYLGWTAMIGKKKSSSDSGIEWINYKYHMATASTDKTKIFMEFILN